MQRWVAKMREKDEKIEMGKREDEGEIGVGMEEINGYEKR